MRTDDESARSPSFAAIDASEVLCATTVTRTDDWVAPRTERTARSTGRSGLCAAITRSRVGRGTRRNYQHRLALTLVADTTPVVDIIIAAHNPERALPRSVGSALENTTPLRVTVVCHNAPVRDIREAIGTAATDSRVRLIPLHDGLHSPSGPFNHGMDQATAEFTSILGSDDELETGTVDSWVKRARTDNADVVMTNLRFASGRNVPTPPVRGRRTSNLDPVRDRLSYRSAPLGLIRRDRFATTRLVANMRNGGDLAYSTALWFSGARLSFDRSGPAYVIHDDADDRVTLRTKSVADELGWLVPMLQSPAMQKLNRSERRSVTAKLIRRHLFGAIDNRPNEHSWQPDDGNSLATALQHLLEFGPDAQGVLSRRDGELIAAVLNRSEAEVLIDRAAARRPFPRFASALPSDWWRVIDPEAPMNLALAQRRLLRAQR